MQNPTTQAPFHDHKMFNLPFKTCTAINNLILEILYSNTIYIIAIYYQAQISQFNINTCPECETQVLKHRFMIKKMFNLSLDTHPYKLLMIRNSLVKKLYIYSPNNKIQ